MAEHRVSMLRSALRRRVDPAYSRDPRVGAVVGGLATLSIAPPPGPAFRAELQAQLVAIAPRIVAESAAAPAATTTATTARATTAAAKAAKSSVAADRKRRLSIGRPLAVTASLVAVLALLLGGAVWMSRKALPGDTLYGLKRASESVQLATASSDREKAQDYLDFAATRAAEVRALLSRSTATAMGTGPLAGARVNSQTASLITDTLRSSDSDVKSAARLLNGEAVRNASTAPLDTMNDWAPGQLTRLRTMAAALPAGAFRTRAATSARLVAAALHRSQLLGAKVHCACLKGAATDALGPLPCSPCAKPATTGRTSSPARGTGTAGPQRRTAPGGTTQSSRHKAPATAHGNAPPTTSRPGGGVVTTPGVPKLPVKLPAPSKPSLPGLSVGKCGVSASLPGIGAGLGLCTPGLHVSPPK